MILGILEQSCVFFPLSLGIYFSYAVLRIADLTTDGTFVLGAALFAVGAILGVDPSIALLASFLGGALAGMAAAFLQTRFQLNSLIVGILLVFILNSLTLKIMGKPNLSLLDRPTIFSSLPRLSVLFPLTALLLAAAAGILASRFGLMLRAFGNNPVLLDLSGKRGSGYRMAGLALSNGLVGFSGALSAQINGYADVGMGTGMILIALGTVILGGQIHRTFFLQTASSCLLRLVSCFFAIILYFSTVHALLALGIDPPILRLVIGLCLLAFLGLTKEKSLFRS